MKPQTMIVAIDASKLHREMSRDKFKSMPKPRRIEDKRRKPPKHRNRFDE